ncbi:hypothetical protein AAL_06108 [Moelleriella libera RCEF 2490]|uniref:Uncharacterized protein n=1 Tax=Moelleriella libera RCEF 2490 TaxID=1081109 RepID=A0A167ZCK8_9HYPO|nr:hypothetical protein AAL_06108 [Moelleriella libera RCEF 2490]
MATVQDRKAPNAGTKVEPGKDAPVRQEGTGLVEEGSLAAESFRADGKFAENRDAEPESASDARSSATSRAGGQSVQGATAPSYVNNQYLSDPKGPHGKNLRESDFDGQDLQSGQAKAFAAEPGSIDDPGRLAEAKFQQKDAVPPQAAPDGGETKLSTSTAFDGLKRDVSA